MFNFFHQKYLINTETRVRNAQVNTWEPTMQCIRATTDKYLCHQLIHELVCQLFNLVSWSVIKTLAFFY